MKRGFLTALAFALLLSSCSQPNQWQNKGKVKSTEKIVLVPIGNVPKEILTFLKEKLAKKFGVEVVIGKSLPFPYYAEVPSRKQFSSSQILDKLLEAKGGKERILGLVDVDLFVENLNFVFGQASLTEKVALISLTRLRQEFYRQPPDANLFLERTLKEAVHELGHTYGLNHCPNSECVMHFSNSLADTDYKKSDFCSNCEKKLYQ